MHWRTEDLLSLADGEPLDAARREAIETAPGAQEALERLAAVRARMRTLPTLEAPPGVWQRIEGTLAAPPQASRHSRHRVAGIAGIAAGLAAVLGIALALLYAGGTPERPAASVVETLPARATPDADYGALLAESARLERMLLQAPSRRGISRAGTASTIAGLEEQIGWIDTLMSETAASEPDASYRRALWRERVMIMDALIDVRFAEASAAVY